MVTLDGGEGEFQGGPPPLVFNYSKDALVHSHPIPLSGHNKGLRKEMRWNPPTAPATMPKMEHAMHVIGATNQVHNTLNGDQK